MPAGKIYSAKDIVQDEHINARGMIEKVTVGTKEEGRGWELKVCIVLAGSTIVAVFTKENT